jgi:hypothetical protein
MKGVTGNIIHAPESFCNAINGFARKNARAFSPKGQLSGEACLKSLTVYINTNIIEFMNRGIKTISKRD